MFFCLWVVVVRYVLKKYKLLELFIDDLCIFYIFYLIRYGCFFFLFYGWVYFNKRMFWFEGEKVYSDLKYCDIFFLSNIDLN